MNVTVIYLDSSAVIKRYLSEPGSNAIRTLYVKAYAGDVKIAFNLWNIGEVLGALDKAWRLGRIDEHEHGITRRRFLKETRRMVKLGVLTVIPVKMKVLIKAWKLTEKHHIYVSDRIYAASGVPNLFEEAVRFASLK